MISKKPLFLIALQALLIGAFNFVPAGAAGTFSGTCPAPGGATPFRITFTFQNNVTSQNIFVQTPWHIYESDPPSPEGVCFHTNPLVDTTNPLQVSAIYLEGSSGGKIDDINCDSVELSGTGTITFDSQLGTISPVAIRYSGSFSSGVMTLVRPGGGEISSFAAAAYLVSDGGKADCAGDGTNTLSLSGTMTFAQYP